MSEVPSSGNLLWGSNPVFTFLWQAIQNFLGKWSCIHIEFMEDHVCLCPYLALLSNDFDELPERERTFDWPFGDPYDKPLLLKSLRVLRFDQYLWELTVVWDKHTVVSLHVSL